MDLAIYIGSLRVVFVGEVRAAEQWSAASTLGALLLAVAVVVVAIVVIRVTLRR